ncbi:MAG TPA: alpha/beta hydrolase [Anaerolineaceae bacterium]|nr:alpha/beta hydrolase [Anaerolineaceae bacterium]
MERVLSQDGTPIAFHKSGSGPPLILVAGTGAANPIAWPGVVPALAADFTVCAVDRRGRGESGDSPAYAREREVEDVAAVAAAAGTPASLLGHSFGALLALEAARLARGLRALILYEPLILRPGAPLPYPAEYTGRLEAMLAAGDRAGVLTAHYREAVGMSPEEIEAMKASPAWPARLASAHTLPREMRAEEAYRFEPERFAGLDLPVMLLLGSESPPFMRESTEWIAAALPQSRVVELPGQGHIAMYSAPELFVREVKEFLTGLP